MIGFFLPFCGLVAVEAGHIFAGVRAELVFVHDGMLEARMAFGTLASRSHEVDRWLLNFDFRPLGIDEERGQNQTEANDERDEDGTKRHGAITLSCATRPSLSQRDPALDLVSERRF